MSHATRVQELQCHVNTWITLDQESSNYFRDAITARTLGIMAQRTQHCNPSGIATCLLPEPDTGRFLPTEYSGPELHVGPSSLLLLVPDGQVPAQHPQRAPIWYGNRSNDACTVAGHRTWDMRVLGPNQD